MTTLVFSTPRRWNLFAWLIRKLTKSTFSHVSIGTDFHRVPVLVEATWRGVKVTLRSKFVKKNVIVEEYEILKRVDVHHAIEHLDDNYDFGGVFGFGVILALRNWFRVKVKNPFVSATALWCSEFVMHIDHAHRVDEWSDLEPEQTHARTLADLCRTGTSFRRIK